MSHACDVPIWPRGAGRKTYIIGPSGPRLVASIVNISMLGRRCAADVSYGTVLTRATTSNVKALASTCALQLPCTCRWPDGADCVEVAVADPATNIESEQFDPDVSAPASRGVRDYLHKTHGTRGRRRRMS